MPKYASASKQPAKKVIGNTNKYSKPVATINLDQNSNGSRGVSGNRSGFDRYSQPGSARQRSNSRKAAIPGGRFTGSDMRRRESDS